MVVKSQEEKQRWGSQDTKWYDYWRGWIGHEDKGEIDAIVVDLEGAANAEKYTMFE